MGNNLKNDRNGGIWQSGISKSQAEHVQRHACFVNVQSSLYENVIFSVCARMCNAAYVIFILWNSISGFDACYHFRLNISHAEKSSKKLREATYTAAVCKYFAFVELIDLDLNDDDIFDQSEAEKLSHTNSLTDKHRINILSGPALRAASAKMRHRLDFQNSSIKNGNFMSVQTIPQIGEFSPISTP